MSGYREPGQVARHQDDAEVRRQLQEMAAGTAQAAPRLADGGRLGVVPVEALTRAAVTQRSSAAARGGPLTERRSVFVWAQMVQVDEYGTNPLAEDIVQTHPEKAAAMLRAGDRAPTLFESGDLPVFTASGISPTALAAVAWPVRHVVARLGAEDAAYLLNRFTPGPTSDRDELAAEAAHMFLGDEENQAYRSRIAAWFARWQPVASADGSTVVWERTDPSVVWRP